MVSNNLLFPSEFQSTLPRRERPGSRRFWTISCNFNPRSREGSDMWEIMLSRMRKYISIHAPAKGATSYAYSSIRGLINFNPRSREGSDYIKWYTNTVMMISIHAPAKGATIHGQPARNILIISIHAPAKGATTLKSRR